MKYFIKILLNTTDGEFLENNSLDWRKVSISKAFICIHINHKLFNIDFLKLTIYISDIFYASIFILLFLVSYVTNTYFNN